MEDAAQKATSIYGDSKYMTWEMVTKMCSIVCESLRINEKSRIASVNSLLQTPNFYAWNSGLCPDHKVNPHCLLDLGHKAPLPKVTQFLVVASVVICFSSVHKHLLCLVTS